MMKFIAALCLVFAIAGCAFNVNVAKTRNAPIGGNSSYVETLRRAPNVEEFTDFAKIEAQGNNWQSASDCEARISIEARQIGADAVLIQPESSGFGKGPACSGTAYYSIKNKQK